MNETKVMSRAAEAAFDGSACRRGVVSPAARRVKRGLDLVASVIGMLVFSPVFLIIYIAVKCEDGGKAIFRQERVGYHGEIFTLYKFRSMVTTSESDGRPALCSGKGEMSFVGPRPERKFFVDKIRAVNPDYELLYQLRPGLFSAATLYNGYTDTMEKMLERLRMDLDYLYNRSLWLDTKIIFLTVFSILTGKKF